MRRSIELRIGLDGLERCKHLALDSVERRLRVTLKAQNQHRRGVGGPNQSKAIGPVNPQAINGVNGCRLGKVRLRNQRFHQGVGFTFGAFDVQLRC